MVSLDKLSMIGTSGFTLCAEEKSALSVAVLSRKQSEGFKDSFKFWGRVTGRDGDYLVAVAYTPAYPFPIKKFFYCATMKPEAVLAQMPDLTDEYATLAAGLVSQPFQGDPSLVIDIAGKEDEPPPEPVDGEEPVEPERFREHHRLAFAVSLIERDVAIIPRGAYLVDTSHQVCLAHARTRARTGGGGGGEGFHARLLVVLRKNKVPRTLKIVHDGCKLGVGSDGCARRESVGGDARP